MKKETRITLIIVAGIVILGLAGFSVLSGAEIDFIDALRTLSAAILGGAGGYLAKNQ
jgi:hypothetical protein